LGADQDEGFSMLTVRADLTNELLASVISDHSASRYRRRCGRTKLGSRDRDDYLAAKSGRWTLVAPNRTRWCSAPAQGNNPVDHN
jgi:hypothetical protein